MAKIAVFWFRRDFRLHDNHALLKALDSGLPVLPFFIFDRNILDPLGKEDARLVFIHRRLRELDEQLRQHNSRLYAVYGKPEESWEKLLENFEVAAVYFNHDYEPYARERDQAIIKMLDKRGIATHTFKDHVLFEGDEVLKDDGNPYVVFTPYSKKWLKRLEEHPIRNYPSEKKADHFFKGDIPPMPGLEDMGFKDTDFPFPPSSVEDELIRKYGQRRDYPGMQGTSRLGVHLRFGTISIRKLAQRAMELSDTYLNELIWRDFYQMILYHFPRVVTESFRPEYDRIPWRNNEAEFDRWCQGKTGYPLVDAGMRELNTTGYMHNRVRMVTASFLTKHLLTDWRWGEAYFAEKLLDYELASNNGGWQWAAGSGCDAAPYFRIFNPASQATKFDKDRTYVKKWLPELDSPDYPEPVVEHKMARERALETYSKALKKG